MVILYEVDGRQIQLSEELAAGGFKKIFDIGDGKVIALRNTNDGLSDLALFGWEEGIEFELRVSDRLSKLGLYTQDYKKIEAKINNHNVPALTMSHFKSLLKKDQQIRCGGKENFGTNMLFGSLDNIKSESYMRKLYHGIISDIVTLIVNKIRLGMDSFGGVVITNTANTLDHDMSVPDLISNRKQEVHLFLMDFYQKQLMFQHGDLVVTNKRFNPKIGEINRTADFYLRMSLYSLCSAVAEYERVKLNQN